MTHGGQQFKHLCYYLPVAIIFKIVLLSTIGEQADGGQRQRLIGMTSTNARPAMAIPSNRLRDYTYRKK